MKKLSLAVALAALVLAPSAGRAVTGNVGVTARIAPPLRITPVTDLNFGELLTDGINAGVIVVDNTSTVTTLSNLIQVSGASSGTFTLSGRSNATVSQFTITAPSPTMTCGTDPLDSAYDCLGGPTVMTLSLPTADFTPGSVLPTGTGVQQTTVSYGARLDTDANQAPGIYTGTLLVTAAY